jgi:ribosomal protein S18 acetylase RimI-like enzyme
MPPGVRAARIEDEPVISRICLLTANAGNTAEPLHHFNELPGLVWAAPYMHMQSAFGFVLEDEESGQVVGYVLGAADTRKYENEAEEKWYPPLRDRYPPKDPEALALCTEQDKHYFTLLQSPYKVPDALYEVCTSHIHINVLPQYQKRGWGRKLVMHAAEHLKTEGSNALYVGIDPKNDAARKFYKRIGFIPGDFDEGEYLVLDFKDVQ